MSEQIPPDAPPPSGGPSPDLPPAPAGEPVSGPPVTSPPGRKRGALVALLVAVVLLVVAAGGAMAYFTLRGAPGAVLDKVPAGADVVFVAHLDPAASQKTNLFRMTEKIPDLGSREELTQRFNEMVDQALGGSGFSHEDLDWIGGEAGGYADIGFGSPTFALIVAVDDEGAAEAALREIADRTGDGAGTSSTTNISGVDVTVGSDGSTWAVFDGVAVVASDENAMRSVIDTANGASTIEGDAAFTDVMNRLPEDNLGFAYVNAQQLIELVGSIPAGAVPNMPSMDQFRGFQGIGYSVAAEPDGLAIDAVVTTDPSELTPEQRDAFAAGAEPTALLSRVPADAYVVLASRSGAGATQGIGQSLDQLAAVDPSTAKTIRRLHLDQLLPHITGDAALNVGPGTGLVPVGGTLMLGIDDPDAVSSWLDRYIPELLEQTELPPGVDLRLTTEEHDGVTITSLAAGPVPTRFSWAVTDDALIAGISPADVAEAIDLGNGTGDAIATDPGFTAATAEVPGMGSVLYLDVQAILAAVKAFLPAEEYQTFLDQGGKDIEPIEAIVAGSGGDERATTLRLFIKIP